MRPLFQYLLLFIFLLFCQCGCMFHPQREGIGCNTLIVDHPTAQSRVNVNRKVFIPLQVLKNEYWKIRGTNNEEDDDDGPAHFTKDKKSLVKTCLNRQSIIKPVYLHTIVTGSFYFKRYITFLRQFCYGISCRLYVFFQVFRI